MTFRWATFWATFAVVILVMATFAGVIALMVKASILFGPLGGAAALLIFIAIVISTLVTIAEN